MPIKVSENFDFVDQQSIFHALPHFGVVQNHNVAPVWKPMASPERAAVGCGMLNLRRLWVSYCQSSAEVFEPRLHRKPIQFRGGKVGIILTATYSCQQGKEKLPFFGWWLCMLVADVQTSKLCRSSISCSADIFVGNGISGGCITEWRLMKQHAPGFYLPAKIVCTLLLNVSTGASSDVWKPAYVN